MSTVVVPGHARQEYSENTLYATVILGAILVASFLLPVPRSDGRILGLPSICMFYDITGLPCPGCGLTRSFVCFAHGQLIDAFHWNLLGPPLWLIFFFLFARAGMTVFLKRPVLPFGQKTIQWAGWAGLITLLSFGGARIAWLLIEHRRF